MQAQAIEHELLPVEQSRLIAEQNDRFRQSIGIIPGDADALEGTVVMTKSISEMPAEFRFALLEKVTAFGDFTADADPHGWHEMGVIEIDETTIWFKIDLYDVDYQMGSPVPEDQERTRRVLTLLRPEEY